MPRFSHPRPTDAELEILRALWQHGPCTVRQVHESLGPRRTGYTTILKLLQIMTQKGLVRRDDRQRSHVYRASQPRQRTLSLLVADLSERAFGGAAGQLALHALSAKKATPEELAEIRRLLDQLEGGAR